MLYVSFRERVVNIPFRTMGIISVEVPSCELDIVFQAKREIRLSIETKSVNVSLRVDKKTECGKQFTNV